MTYLAGKHVLLQQTLKANPPPVLPIAHGPSDLEALAAHVEEVSHQFNEYLWALCREASVLGVEVKPEYVTGLVKDALHDGELASLIRSEAEKMVERHLEAAE